MEKTKIILDVDTGSDDAVAIMAALLCPDIEVLGICSTHGNRDIDTTTSNTLRVVELLKSNVPVYRGAAAPVVKYLCPDRLGNRWADDKAMKAIEVDGKQVTMHADFDTIPMNTTHEQDMSATEFYLHCLRTVKEPITIVTTGPMTNLALALRASPSIKKNIKEIVSMAGAHVIGNGTPRGEGNVIMDPEACQMVLEAGCKMTMVPLDATHEAYITKADCEKIRALDTVAGNFAADQIEQRIIVHDKFQPLAELGAAAVHDPLCIAYLIDPECLKDVRHVFCVVGLRDFSEGNTIIDQRYYTDPPNVYFAYHGDRHRFVKVLLDLFARSEKAE